MGRARPEGCSEKRSGNLGKPNAGAFVARRRSIRWIIATRTIASAVSFQYS